MIENNMCSMCNNSINGVNGIISYVKDTEESINKLKKEIKRLRCENEILKEGFEKREYSLLAQKEIIIDLDTKIRNITCNMREFSYRRKVLNMLDEILLNVNAEFYNIIDSKEDVLNEQEV